ncbi:ATP-dependent zinc metalloprotease FtsH [Clostridium sp. CTA-19]
MKKNENKIYFITAIATILISFSIMVAISFKSSKIDFKPYNEFLNDLNTHSVSTVYLVPSPKIEVLLNNGTSYLTDNPDSNTLRETLLSKNVSVKDKSNTYMLQTISSIFLIISIGYLTISTISKKKSKGGISSLNTEDVSSVAKEKFNFNSLAGNEEAKESVKDIVDYLKFPEKYKKYGARVPKGVILYGDPGTGKTLLAKAIAGEANVPFYAVSGSDFIQVYVGVGASRVRNLFKKAKAHKKAVIFIDEIDAIGKKRSNSTNGSSEEKDQTLNALLTEMSGFNEDEGIIVIAATNRLDILDPALLRPGRFDRHIEIGLPDVSAREKIISLHLKNKPFNNLNIKDIAIKTAYFSGAKIENLINEAAILACKESSDFITNEHIDTAFSTIIAGHEKINTSSFKYEDKKITAYHEAGHCLISLLELPEEKVSKVSIIPTTKGAGGYTLTLPTDKSYQNLEYLSKKIMVFLGGRAAEELIFGENHITTGAYSDLKQSSNMIYNMIAEYGMGKSLGLLRLSEMPTSIQNASAKMVLDECKDTIDTLYFKTKTLLLDNIDNLNILANELMDKETLSYDCILKLIEQNN